MRRDPASVATGAALAAGLAVVVVSLSSSPHRAQVDVTELPAVALHKEADDMLGVDSGRFLVSAYGSNLLVDSTAPVAADLSRAWLEGYVVWDEGAKAYVAAGYSGLVSEKDPDWHSAKPLRTTFVGPASALTARDGVAFMGTPSSALFRIEGADITEQKFTGGEVTAAVALGSGLVVFVEDAADDERGTLYLVDPETLEVAGSQGRARIDRLVALDRDRFLAVDAKGLWLGSVSGGALALTLCIEGTVALSRNASDGLFVASVRGRSTVMRLDQGRLQSVGELEGGELRLAAFSGRSLAVVFEQSPREVRLYLLQPKAEPADAGSR